MLVGIRRRRLLGGGDGLSGEEIVQLPQKAVARVRSRMSETVLAPALTASAMSPQVTRAQEQITFFGSYSIQKNSFPRPPCTGGQDGL